MAQISEREKNELKELARECVEIAIYAVDNVPPAAGYTALGPITAVLLADALAEKHKRDSNNPDLDF